MEDGRGATEVWVPSWHRGSGTRWACGGARGSDGWQGPREEPRPPALRGPWLWVLHSLFALPAQRYHVGGRQWWWRAWCWGSEPGAELRSRRGSASGPSCSSASCSAPHSCSEPAGLVSVENWGSRFSLSPMATVHKVPEVDDVVFHRQLVHS